MAAKKSFQYFITVLIIAFTIMTPNVAGYSGGSGTPEAPYQIDDVDGLLELAADTGNYDKCFILTADIDLQGQVFTTAIIAADTVAGNYSFEGTAFTGTFDGNGHKITHFTINGGSNWYLGLFGYIFGGDSVKNLGLENFSVSGTSSVGGLVGYNGGIISNCHSTGVVSGSSRGVGGLVGRNEGGTITNCYSTGSVSGNYYVGGLVGLNHYGTISNCYAAGNVSGNSLIIHIGGIGGLVGCNHEYGTISNCYSTGTVTAADDMAVGGLVGHNWSTITNCYSTGSVSGDLDVGGLVGISYDTISNCYSTGTVTADDRGVGGLVGLARGTISNCNSTGAVTGGDRSGGLVGYSEQGTITNCYSTGSVSGDTGVGGLVGYIYDGSVVGSFWDVNTSGQMTSAGGTGKTTEQMQDINTFISAGWDFINETANGTCNYWQMPAGGGYPVLSTFNGYIPPEPSGSGTEDDPYVITDANDLGTIWYRPYAHYVLANDINLAGIQWSIAVAPVFGGALDGNGFCIKNLSIYGANNLGLFGRISSGGSVKNLGLENCAVSGVSDSWYIGGLVGENYGNISNCYSTGTVTGGDESVSLGGLVGRNYRGSISNCYSTAVVSGSSWGVGGLVGGNNGSISNCYSTGTVSGSSWDVGGLVGGNNGSISNCYSTGEVSGDSDVGGLVGDNYGNISNCYSTGEVSGSSHRVGGLVGGNRYGSIENCYSIGPVSGDSRVGGLCGSNGDEGPHSGGLIKNCYSTGTVSGSSRIGGLVGSNHRRSSISCCYSTGEVSGDSDVGGLVGSTWHGSISNCYSTGVVSGSFRVGGLVGQNNRGTISCCYSTGDVSGDSEVGGLVGVNRNDFYYQGGISSCYSTGAVSGDDYVGGLVGYDDEGTVTACFWDVNTSGQATSAGGTGKTTADMKTLSTFTSAGWDFDYTDGDPADWFIQIDEYPILTWQISPADIYTDGRNNFRDFAVFTQYWMRDDCAIYNYYCDWADMDFDGFVDIDDLVVLMSYWLESGIYDD